MGLRNKLLIFHLSKFELYQYKAVVIGEIADRFSFLKQIKSSIVDVRLGYKYVTAQRRVIMFIDRDAIADWMKLYKVIERIMWAFKRHAANQQSKYLTFHVAG